MEKLQIENLTFTYPGKSKPSINNVSFDVKSGEFVLICGKSGSGKSTLLRNFKSVLRPYGKRTGHVFFCCEELENIGEEIQSSKIGYVLQNIDAQIVTDKVWHELAFGLENLSMPTETIRMRVAEMANFFGIQNWFSKDVSQLSGGQKQILNLASVMVMQPEILILDEPTGQLDPIAAENFTEVLRKINRELGTTILISEHKLENILSLTDKMIVLDEGTVIAEGRPGEVGRILAQTGHEMFSSLPVPMKCALNLQQEGIPHNPRTIAGWTSMCPLDVNEGRSWLNSVLDGADILNRTLPEESRAEKKDTVIEVKEAWYRYGKQEDDVIKGMSFEIFKGEFICIVGGNGSGKTTALRLMCGLNVPYRGTVKVEGKKIEKYGKNEIFRGTIGLLPQDPKTLFAEKTVKADLLEMLDGNGLTDEEKGERIRWAAKTAEIEDFLDMHPYDLSGGEQQRAALAKILLLSPRILLLDEPTKGLDNNFKDKLAGIIKGLCEKGVTVVLVSHDLEFCAKYAHRCAMFFDGGIISENTPGKFFGGNSFYTTAANRMSKHIFHNAVTEEDVIELVKSNLKADMREKDTGFKGNGRQVKKPVGRKGDSGCTSIREGPRDISHIETRSFNEHPGNKVEKKNKLFLDIFLVIAVIFTVTAGYFFLGNEKYFILCAMLIVYAMVPFFYRFEKKRVKTREIVILAVLISVAVIGRAAFFMIPNFKPMLAVIIVAGVSLGKEDGLLTGAMSALISNMIFGQGPWTPYQMAAMALSGYLAGWIFYRGREKFSRWAVIVYGAIAAFFIYGGLVDLWTILMMSSGLSLKIAIGVYAAAVPFNIIHAVSTVVFLLLLLKPMTEKIDRIKFKYGMGI